MTVGTIDRPRSQYVLRSTRFWDADTELGVETGSCNSRAIDLPSNVEYLRLIKARESFKPFDSMRPEARVVGGVAIESV